MQVSTVYINDYSGGLNNTTHRMEIGRNEASYLTNWDITYRGQLRRRDGLLQFGDTLSAAPSGLHTYLRKDGSKDLLVTEGTNLKYLNSTTFANLDTGFTSGTSFAFATVPYNDKVYLCNEDNQIHSWDRASTTSNSCLTDLGAAVPHGNKLAWHKNHMFTANNVNVSGTKYPNRLYWSAFGDPDTWDTTNDFIELPGGGRLINIEDWGDFLVIYKENSIMYLSGYGDADWRIDGSATSIVNIDEAVGSASPRGATRVGNEIWFVDDEGYIRRQYKTFFDAFRRDIVSTKIQGTIDGINKSKLDLVSMWTYNDKVFVSVPNGSDTYNSLVMVYDLIASKRTGKEAWTTYTGWRIDYAVTYPTSTSPDLVLCSSNTKKVYKHTGDDDDGSAIDARWDGKDDDFDNPDTYKRYRFGRITGESGDADVDVGIYASVDDASFASLGNLNLGSIGGTLGPTGHFELFPTGTTGILAGSSSGDFRFLYSDGGGSVSGKSIRHSIRHSTLNEQPIVNGLTCHYKEKRIR